MAREFTHALWDARNEGLVSNEAIVSACLNYMSEDQVRDMVEREELLPEYMINRLNGEDDDDT